MKKALIGYGGHAKEIMAQMGEVLPCYVDDKYVCENTQKLSDFDSQKFKVMIAIAEPESRKKIKKSLPKNTIYFSFIHPTAQIMDKSVKIGKGTFIGANSILTTNINIGHHAILNRGNHIGHDCTIGDFFSAMPNVVISGNVNIKDTVYIGANSTIKEKLSIFENIVIGMGSVVTKDLVKSGIHYGNPAKFISLIENNNN